MDHPRICITRFHSMFATMAGWVPRHFRARTPFSLTFRPSFGTDFMSTPGKLSRKIEALLKAFAGAPELFKMQNR
jgi:hypothetical protein